jgi:hypothetical protein
MTALITLNEDDIAYSCFFLINDFTYNIKKKNVMSNLLTLYTKSLFTGHYNNTYNVNICLVEFSQFTNNNCYHR